MSNKIKWIIDESRYWDKTYGNSYYITRVTNTRTGKSELFSDCAGNMRSVVARVDYQRTGKYQYNFHRSETTELMCREWRARRDDIPSPYTRSKNGLVNNTERMIRDLTRSK